jgi:hypothetical protein
MSSSTPPSDGASDQLTCPSARCEPGATLLGVVEADGTVGYITPRLTVDAAFVEQASRGRAPEKRFRFAGACVEAGCKQWTGSRCGVIDGVLESGLTDDLPEARGLPHCSIRSSCRWFAQSGAEACGVCPLVITDTV